MRSKINKRSQKPRKMNVKTRKNECIQTNVSKPMYPTTYISIIRLSA